MPNIPKHFRECVFYLYKSVKDAKEGTRAGGCGFFVSVASELYGEDGLAYRYAVSCGHLIEKHKCLTIRVNTEDGEHECFETNRADWELSEDNDVAACPIELDNQKHIFHDVYYRMPESLVKKHPDAFAYPRLTLFVTEKIINDEGVGMGDEVFLVGRLIDHSGKQKNTPSARFGNISMMPIEPIYNDFLDKEVDAFLCEVKSIGGFSGSPVFAYLPAFSWRPEGRPRSTLDKGPWLLGIDWGHTRKDEKLLNGDGDPVEGYYIQRDSGIACVAPAWYIGRLLDCKRFVTQRAKEDDELHEQQLRSPTALDAAPHAEDEQDANQIATSNIDRVSEK